MTALTYKQMGLNSHPNIIQSSSEFPEKQLNKYTSMQSKLIGPDVNMLLKNIILRIEDELNSKWQ